MNKQLVLSALGTDQPGLVDKISRHILDLKLNIEDSRMSVLGGEFAIMLL
ncbi:MAG: glycine cleavage system protein R, partial [Gammaproteobacteria bacterium]|nr:glycine cleavage system protein R [Gammaproteobacteria bacterium]